MMCDWSHNQLSAKEVKRQHIVCVGRIDEHKKLPEIFDALINRLEDYHKDNMLCRKFLSFLTPIRGDIPTKDLIGRAKYSLKQLKSSASANSRHPAIGTEKALLENLLSAICSNDSQSDLLDGKVKNAVQEIKKLYESLSFYSFLMFRVTFSRKDFAEESTRLCVFWL